MLDPRLQLTLARMRQRELEEQAARDRFAASQRAERHALGRLLTAAGTALLALGTRLHGAPAPAPKPLAHIATAPGARTGFLCPELRTFYIATPRRGQQGAEIRTFTLPN